MEKNLKNEDHKGKTNQENIQKVEELRMISDLKMLNKRIQNSEGIIALSEADFTSLYGKKRYKELKSIPEGKSVSFNKYELQTIGDELEKMLSGESKVEKKDSENLNKKDEEVVKTIKEPEENNESKTEKKDVIVDIQDEKEVKKDAEISASEKIKREAILNTKKIVIVDTEEMAEAEARKAADAYMTEDKAKSNIFKKFWKHTFLEAYYRGREVDRVRKEIINSGNLYAGRVKNDNKESHDNTMQAISERFASDYEGTIKEGENKEILNDTDPKTIQARTDIKNLINEYTKGNLNEEAFVNEKNRIFNNLNNKDLRRASNSYADNLFEIAKNARIAIEHGAKMDELDLDTNIILGKARSSLKTEAHYNNVDKAVAWTKKSKIGRFLSPTLISTSIGLGYSLSVGLGAKFLRSKVAAYGTFGAAVAVSSALSGINESQRLAAERAQHGLEMAEGGQIGPDSKRREQMEEFQYKMESSKNLAERLRGLMFEKDKDGNDISKDIKQADLDKIFASLAEIDARNSLNAKNKIDLISYTNIGSVEKESTDLTILVARAKKELGDKLKGNLKNGLPQGETFESYLAKQTQVVERCLLGGEKGIDANDKAFSKFKTKESFKKALKTAVIGLTIGATVQEVVAFFKDDVQGFIEGIFQHGGGHDFTTQTPIEHIHNWITGHPTHMPMGHIVETHLDGHDFKLPEGTSILHNTDGTYNIFRGGQVVSDHIPLHFDSSNNLDAVSIARLGEDGIVANTTCTMIDGTEHVNGNADDYIKNHPGGTTHIARDGWYDNNTPKPIFDQNELKLHWGGNMGTDANGNYVLDVSHMTSGGSFHNEFSVDAQEKIKAGALKIIFSLTQGTQHQVFEVPIDIHGNAVVDPNSEIGKLFFGTDNGHAIFKGRFAEVVQSFGAKDGIEHIKSLATLEGPGNDTIDQIIPTHVEIPVTNLDLPVDTEPPYFIPLIARTPLEKLKEQEKAIIQYYYNGGNLNDIQKEFEQRNLKQDPYTIKNLDDGNKVWIDKDGKEVRRDSGREKARITTYLEQQNKEYLKEIKDFNKNLEPMNKDCRVSVIIPARFEEKNLKNLLDQYIKQVDEKGNPLNKDLFEINIIINRKEGEKSDRSMEVLNEWKKANPGYHVNAVDIVFAKEKANVGMARKYITDISLMRSVERTSSSGPLYIESEDADLFSVDKRTINKLINGFDKKPYLDVLRGIQDRQPELMSKNDLFFFERRLWDIGEMAMRDLSLRSDKFDRSSFTWNRVISGGWNTAYTAESYAQIGGYVSDIIGEDMKIGQKISVLRGKEDIQDNKFKINTYTAETSGLRSNSSPRRFLDAMIKKESPYDNFEDQSVKEKTLESLFGGIKEFEKISPEHKGRYESGINTLYDFMKNEMGAGKEVRQTMEKTLFYLGLKQGDNLDCIFNKNDKIEMTSKGYKKIGELLSNYRNEEKWKLGYRRQNSPVEMERTKINKNKKENATFTNEDMEKGIEIFMDRFSNNTEKIDSLNKLVNNGLDDEFLKKIGLSITVNEIKNKLEGCKKIKNKEDFNKSVKDILNPIGFALEKNPKESIKFQRKIFAESHNLTPVNEIFCYGINKGDLHLHIAPASDLSTSIKYELLKDAIKKLATIVSLNKEVKEISATSWIVESNPGLLKGLGFKIGNLTSEEANKIDLSDEANSKNRAVISREDFLVKHNK
jgi:ElaB/YqjD/DUF883 family membrane-anchored ribosome-binding protein